MLNSSFKKPFHLRLIFTMDKNSSDGVPLPQRYGAILTIVLGLTMAVLDGAIANVA
ncbi:TPA: MFS transporter, partial [Klebsiella pneumoniae]|nr:MFS transporter [Klebsiella pneumoniae]